MGPVTSNRVGTLTEMYTKIEALRSNALMERSIYVQHSPYKEL